MQHLCSYHRLLLAICLLLALNLFLALCNLFLAPLAFATLVALGSRFIQGFAWMKAKLRFLQIPERAIAKVALDNQLGGGVRPLLLL